MPALADAFCAGALDCASAGPIIRVVAVRHANIYLCNMSSLLKMRPWVFRERIREERLGPHLVRGPGGIVHAGKALSRHGGAHPGARRCAILASASARMGAMDQRA